MIFVRDELAAETSALVAAAVSNAKEVDGPQRGATVDSTACTHLCFASIMNGGAFWEACETTLEIL